MYRLTAMVAMLLPAAAAAVQEAAAPVPEVVSAGSALQILAALLLVLGLILGMAWLLRRFGSLPGSGGSGPLRVLTSAMVGQRERVVLVQVGERQLLLGVAPGRVEMLHVLEQPVEVAGRGGERFAERFAAALKQRRDP